MFEDQDQELWKLRQAQGENILYLICGPYADTRQHFVYNMRPILRGGLKCLYDQAQAQRSNTEDTGEIAFLNAVCVSLLAMKRISQKFADEAEKN